MKKMFSRVLAGVLIAGLLMTPVAVMEEDDGSINIILESPVEDLSVTVSESEEQLEMIDMVVEEAEDVELEGDTEWVEESEPFELEVDDETPELGFMEGQSADEAYDPESLMEGGSSVTVDSSNFPDDGFRQYVSDFIDTDLHNGVLSAAEIASVKRIALLGSGYGVKAEAGIEINNLKGIEYFTELTYLECFWCGLEDLDISHNTKLTYLNCAMNGLSKLDVSKNTELSVLACYGNSFTQLDISNLRYLVAIIADQYMWEREFYKGDCFIAYTQSMLNLSEDNDTIWGLSGPFLAYDDSVWLTIDNPTLQPNPGSGTTSIATPSTGSSETYGPLIPAIKRSSKVTITAAPGTYCGLDLGGATGRKFKSSRKNVATIDSTGMVTIHGAGKTYITFKVGKRSRKVKLTVKDPTVPSSVSLNMSGIITVHKGDTVTLVPSIPARTNSTFKWSTNKKRVATVSNGVVTFKRSGKVTITVTCTRGKKKAKVKFKVIK